MLKPTFAVDPLADPAAFRKALNRWFRHEGKDYPWRRTTDPYAILVSEVMLQQTQISTVLGRGFYMRFIELFPNVQTLAVVSDEKLLKAWEGLGYYRRVRGLRAAAQMIVADHGGQFPSEFADVLRLPGVGRYTAGAVVSFAYNQAAPIVDGNIVRVLSRLFDFHEVSDTGAGHRRLWELATALLDEKNPRVYNSALMELGQTLCRPKNPDCLECPVSQFCKTRVPAELPKRTPRSALEAIDEHAIFVRRGNQVLLQQLGAGRRQGMWRLPLRTAEETRDGRIVHRRNYGITRFRVTLRLYICEREGVAEPRENEAWCGLEETEQLAMPPADRQALQAAIDAT